jgi:hypothetical protein
MQIIPAARSALPIYHAVFPLQDCGVTVAGGFTR